MSGWACECGSVSARFSPGGASEYECVSCGRPVSRVALGTTALPNADVAGVNTTIRFCWCGKPATNVVEEQYVCLDHAVAGVLKFPPQSISGAFRVVDEEHMKTVDARDIAAKAMRDRRSTCLHDMVLEGLTLLGEAFRETDPYMQELKDMLGDAPAGDLWESARRHLYDLCLHVERERSRRTEIPEAVVEQG